MRSVGLRPLVFAMSVVSLMSLCLPQQHGIKRRIVIGGVEHSIPIETSGWPSHNLISWLARILLEERVGYDITFNTISRPAVAQVTEQLTGCSPGETACSATAPKSFANLEVWSGANFPVDLGSNSFEDLGGSGVVGRAGWYANDEFVERQWTNRSVIVDDFRSYTKQQGADWFEGAKTNSTINQVAQASIAATTQYEYGDDYSCEAGGSASTGFEADAPGCADGWWHPPKCEGRVSECATLLGLAWESHRQNLTAALTAMKVDVAAVWLPAAIVRKVVAERVAREAPVLFQWWSPSAFLLEGKYSRVSLPECPVSGTPGVSGCDYPHVMLRKYAWGGLKSHAPAAHQLLQRMAVSNADLSNMLAALAGTGAAAAAPQPDNGVNGNASKSPEYAAACAWLRANPQKWAAWLPDTHLELDTCGRKDYNYTVHPCSGGKRAVEFEWNHPAADDPSQPDDCAVATTSDASGAITVLPPWPAESVSVWCGYVDSASSASHSTLLVLAALTAVTCALCGGFVMILYNHKTLLRTQPWLLLTNLLGCVMLLLPMFWTDGPWTSFKCSGTIAFDGLGITLIIGSYIVKAWFYMHLFFGKQNGGPPSGSGSGSSGSGSLAGREGQGVRRLTPLRLPKFAGSKSTTAQSVGAGPRRSSALRVHNKIRGVLPDPLPRTEAEGLGQHGATGGDSKQPLVRARRTSLAGKVAAGVQAVVTTGGKIVEYSGANDHHAAPRHIWQIACFVAVEALLVALRLGLSPLTPRQVVMHAPFGAYEEVQCASDAEKAATADALAIVFWLYKLLLLLVALYATYNAQKFGLMQSQSVCDSPIPSLLMLAGWALFALSYHHFGVHTAANDYAVYGIAKVCGVCCLCMTTFTPLVHTHVLGSGRRVHVLSRSYLIAEDQIKLMKPIGGGSFSDVLKGKYKQTQVAVKRLRGDISEVQMRAFGKEVVMMAELHHPNVVMMMGFCIKPPLLIMEYLGRGSLYNLLHASNTQLEWTMVLKILSDTACGMSYLHAHQPPLIHADLKTPNILVDLYWRCKIADLGLAKLKEDTRLGSMNGMGGKVGSACAQVGSLLWCAPELFTSKRVTTRSDTYAFGIVMYECIYRRVPFSELSPMAVPLKVVDGVRPLCPEKPPQNTDTLGPAFTQLNALMEACWHHDPLRRPPFEHVLAQLEWMAEDYTGQENWEGAVIFPVTDERMSSADDQSMVASISSAVRQGYTMMESDLELGFKIGEGNYGTVLEGIYLGTKVAVKQLFVDGMGQSVLNEFHKEVDLMKECNHPNLVALLGAVEAPPKLLLVTELLERGSLWDMYHSGAKNTHFRKLSEHMAFGVRLALDVAKGMVHLHKKGIIHRDLKSQNIWLSEDYAAKVGDFGMSRIASHHTMTMVGSPLWCAPEILKSMNYTYSADVYSYSIILYEAFHWIEPYIKMSVMEIMIAVTEHHERPEIEMSVPEAMCTLICDCWQPDASKRPTFEDIVERITEFVQQNPQYFSEKHQRKRISGRKSGAIGGGSREPSSPREVPPSASGESAVREAAETSAR